VSCEVGCVSEVMSNVRESTKVCKYDFLNCVVYLDRCSRNQKYENSNYRFLFL